MKLQGAKSGRKGQLSVATEVIFTEIICTIVFMLIKTSLKKLISLFPIMSKFVLNAFTLQVFEVAPSFCMVELRKSGGDTLEFHKVVFSLCTLFLLCIEI